MGEEGETIEFFNDHLTYFFWNVDDYPVPVDTDVKTVRSNIVDALNQMGFWGHMFFYVNSKQLKSNEIELFKAENILYIPDGTDVYRDKLADVHDVDTSFYLILLTGSTPAQHRNIALFVKPNSDPDSELQRVLNCLKSRGHNVLLVELPPDEECLLSVDSLVKYSRLLGGGKPRHKKELTDDDLRPVYGWELRDEDDEFDDSNFSNKKMLDFSERIRHLKGINRTVIFWDTVDCPFPPSLSPDQIFDKIKTALWERGYGDYITIWAYDHRKWSPDMCLGDKTWESRIYFLPGGDEATRRIRMLSDMYLLSRDSPLRCCRGSMILVSDHFAGDPYYMEWFRLMQWRKYYLVLLVPGEISNISESPDEWPGYLLDSPPETSEEPLPKKPKLDAT